MFHRIALRARPHQHFVYSGRSVLITNLDGNITGRGTEGFAFANTRVLSDEAMTANGVPLDPVVASPVGGAALLAYAAVPAMPGVPEKSVYLAVSRFVDDGLRTVLRVENYATRETARFDLAIALAADFADTEEAEDGKRQQNASVETQWCEERREVVFRYRHPQLDRAVAIRVEHAPSPVRYADGALIVSLLLPPHEPVELEIAVEPIFDGTRYTAPPAFAHAATPLARVRQHLRETMPSLTTTNATVACAWQTAVSDLASLPLGLATGPATPIAGLPLYQQFFGRDSLTIGWQALLAGPTMLRDALRENAAWQGTEINDWLDEEPGKLIHQARWGPLSSLGIDPLARYYGDYATPPDFVIMLAQYFAWTNDRETVRALLPAARRAIDWMERYGDIDNDGFLDYVTRSQKGVPNQGWKDSDDAIVDERGEIIKPPIAASELQAYWYAALEQGSLLYFAMGDRPYALNLRRRAAALKRRFDAAFWMKDEDLYALALGPDKRQIRSIASNAGHLLTTGIVPRAKGPIVARRLMAPDMFSGWGIRTLSSGHAAYNPFSYHRGSVWAVENGTIGFGFARYGCWEELHRLAEGVFASTELFVDHRLPEAIGGLPRDARHPHPGIYPRSCEPQGWSASMIVLLIQALLGMRAVAPLGLLLIDPHLPEWLPDLRLEGVRVGESVLDLRLWRAAGGGTRYTVTRRAGAVRVLRQPVPQGRRASLVGRARALFPS
jgi:glycogen debranching enzyme